MADDAHTLAGEVDAVVPPGRVEGRPLERSSLLRIARGLSEGWRAKSTYGRQQHVALGRVALGLRVAALLGSLQLERVGTGLVRPAGGDKRGVEVNVGAKPVLLDEAVPV